MKNFRSLGNEEEEKKNIKNFKYQPRINYKISTTTKKTVIVYLFEYKYKQEQIVFKLILMDFLFFTVSSFICFHSFILIYNSS